MNQYPNAGAGLKQMFIAQVGVIICIVCASIPSISLISMIGAIVFVVISLFGLYSLGKDIEECKMAFILTIVGAIVNILAKLLANVPVVGPLLKIAYTVISLLVVYFVCIPVSGALSQIGATDIADLGQTVWKLNLVCYAASIVCSILAMIPVLAVIGVLVSIFVLIAALVGEIMYMVFLYKSYNAFGA